MFPVMMDVLPQLKARFERAFLSISPKTEQRQAERIAQLQGDPFFDLNFNALDTLPGEHFRGAYQQAADYGQPQQVVHLCDIDRIAFAAAHYADTFWADIDAAIPTVSPLLFQRSEAAWATHPQKYRAIEGWVMEAGEMVFGRKINTAWSHMAITVEHLRELLPRIRSRDFSLLIEIVILLQDRLTLKPVDWLAWEDPFLYGRDADELRAERDNSQVETERRLRGILPFFQHVIDYVSPLTPSLTWDKPIDA